MKKITNKTKIVPGVLFRETGELSVNTPALPRPTLRELKNVFPLVESVERDTSPTEAVTLKLGTVLRLDEASINSKEYERRLLASQRIVLGYQQAAWLVEHQDEFPELMALLGKIYIDFSGLVVVLEDGRRSFPYLLQRGKRWYVRWFWIGLDLIGFVRVAVSGKSLSPSTLSRFALEPFVLGIETNLAELKKRIHA